MTKEQQNTKKKAWNWIKIIFLLLGLFSGSALICQWWTERQQLEQLRTHLQELKDQAQQQYQLQNIHLISTADLVNSPAIHSFFTDLLTTYARKFAKNKNLDISHWPLKFAGLYSDPKTGNGYGEMGGCWKEKVIYPYQTKEINISLNRLYLLNKFGQDKYFTSNPEQSNNYTYLNISFHQTLKTCAHEIAHYIQLVKHGKSSCKSDLKLDDGEYNPILAQEHKQLTKEIYQMIKIDYFNWENKWQEI